MQVHRRLRDTRLLEVITTALKHHVRQAKAEYLVCPLHLRTRRRVFVVQILAHARVLRPLPGENKCLHISYILARKITKKNANLQIKKNNLRYARIKTTDMHFMQYA